MQNCIVYSIKDKLAPSCFLSQNYQIKKCIQQRIVLVCNEYVQPNTLNVFCGVIKRTEKKSTVNICFLFNKIAVLRMCMNEMLICCIDF